MRLIKFILLYLFCLITSAAYGQEDVRGKLYDKGNSIPVIGATITLTATDTTHYITTTDTNGYFAINHVPAGKYVFQCNYLGYHTYKSVIQVSNKPVNLHTVWLIPTDNVLQEVKVIEKVMAVVQKNDTTEYNAGAFKTNPDASGTDLIRKLPGMQLFGKNLKAQGENVVKILVDGKPFFGSDPYATLSNLSADMIAKVQVYDEKTDQEQFTGVSSMSMHKTVNIVTKPDKRHGTFGKAYGGYGNNQKYIAGGNINSFNGEQQLAVTAQSNNINVQNFTPETIVGTSAANSVATTSSAGIDYSDEWSKKLDFSGSFFYNHNKNTLTNTLHRQYMLPDDSGEVYKENNTTSSFIDDYRLDMRLNYKIDSFNSILIQPQLSFQKNSSTSIMNGTTVQSDDLLSQTNNYTPSNLTGYVLNNSVLYRRQFRKSGRKLSLSIDADNNSNSGYNKLLAQNSFYNSASQGDTLNQYTDLNNHQWRINGNAIYIEPISKNASIDVLYNVIYQPAGSVKNTYNSLSDQYNNLILDTALSNTFASNSLVQKEGIAFRLNKNRYDFSLVLNYEQSSLRDQEQSPAAFIINKHYTALLPMLSFMYKISKDKSFHVYYNVNTSLPAIEQLQNVVNNTNPLLLTTGNASLNQSYTHSATLRYSATNPKKMTNFFIMLNGNYIQNFITNNSIIAQHDTLIQQGILLPKGAQLTTPVNVNGYWALRSYIGYSIPFDLIKSNLSFNLNAAVSRLPGVINNQPTVTNHQEYGGNLNISSNISDNIDFTLSSSATLNTAHSSLNALLNNTYINATSTLNLNWIFWKGFFINTELDQQYNSGLSAGYNQNYLLWNIGIGKKLFSKHQGDLRFFIYDALDQNNNIRHNVTETYIEDAQSNSLHRYFMLIFTYHIKA